MLSEGENIKKVKKMQEWLEDTVKKMSINFRKKSTNNFTTTLLDLFLYDNDEL